MSKRVDDLTSQYFFHYIETAPENTLVLVDFWATWCAPCKAMHNILDRLAEEYAEKLIVAKVDVDQNEAVSEDITSVPTFKFYMNGKLVKSVAGAKPYGVMKKEIDEVLDGVL